MEAVLSKPERKVMTDEVAIWEPKPFPGNDLLPMERGAAAALAGPSDIPIVGNEHIDPDDLVLPCLTLLHGTSKAVTDRVADAEPGRFMHTGTEEVLPEGPVRVIVIHYHKGNALFPKEDPRYKDLQTCISPDQVEGTVYGSCDECKKCTEWDDENNLPPLGAEVHHFTCMTSWGPVIMRFTRSSYKAGSKFCSDKSLAEKNWFAHPAVVRVVQSPKTLASGKTTMYHHMQIAWQVTERVPDEVQRQAYELYKGIVAKHQSGNFKAQAESDEDFD